jgi:uncharacterized alkaline shock family protein YloU
MATTTSETTTSNGGKSRSAEKKASSGGQSGGTIGGRLDMADDVVATIAGLAAREIKGIHALGAARLISFGDDPKRGVDVEIGQREAALDLDVVIEYGCNIHETVADLRERIASVVHQMAGRQVVEVNINVRDIHLPEEEGEKKPAAPEPRVH